MHPGACYSLPCVEHNTPGTAALHTSCTVRTRFFAPPPPRNHNTTSVQKMATLHTPPSQFHYTHALCRGLPASFLDSLKLAPPPEPVNMAVARAQHDAYTHLLRQLVPCVVELPADEACPDCVFIGGMR